MARRLPVPALQLPMAYTPPIPGELSALINFARAQGWDRYIPDIADFNSRRDPVLAVRDLRAAFHDWKGSMPWDFETSDCLLFACTQLAHGLDDDAARVHLTALAMAWCGCLSMGDASWLENTIPDVQAALIALCARKAGPQAAAAACETLCAAWPLQAPASPMALAICIEATHFVGFGMPPREAALQSILEEAAQRIEEMPGDPVDEFLERIHGKLHGPVVLLMDDLERNGPAALLRVMEFILQKVKEARSSRL